MPGAAVSGGAEAGEAVYCQYCTDESGALKSRDAVREGIAGWLASWAPDKTADFSKRADSYMSAMPAWTKS
jgi:hypothetical protein